MGPGNQRTRSTPYDTVLASLPDALKTEGFGVLTQIDVRNTLRGIEDGDRTVVIAVDPLETIAATSAKLAEDVRARLSRVLEKLS